MREVIIREWRDDLGIVHRDEIGKLVRCKNCTWSKWSKRDKCYKCHCHIPIFTVLPDGFCDKGEEKE